MGLRYWDISVPLYDGMLHWPSDPPVSITAYKEPEKGDRSTVSLLSMGSHTGTHVDAPRHFLPGQGGVDEIAVEKLIGPCVVLDCRGRRTVKADVLRGVDMKATPRVLFRTDNSDHWWGEKFSDDFVGLEEETALQLVAQGAVLAGVDSLSVEKRGAPSAAAHHALLGSGLVIVEGLNLSGIEPGVYQLFCLPLCIRHGDGAPARAILARENR